MTPVSGIEAPAFLVAQRVLGTRGPAPAEAEGT